MKKIFKKLYWGGVLIFAILGAVKEGDLNYIWTFLLQAAFWTMVLKIVWKALIGQIFGSSSKLDKRTKKNQKAAAYFQGQANKYYGTKHGEEFQRKANYAKNNNYFK